MLTDSERVWVKYRQIFNGYYPYGCLTCSLQGTLCDKTDCLLHPDLGDALEFSERVAAKLADWLASDMGCFVCGEKICKKQKDRSCGEKLLQAARLAAEKEIGNG